MPKAVWNGTVVAESDDTVVVEGNHYFPVESLRADLVVEGQTNPGAVWYYPTPEPAAEKVTDRVAFWRGVTVEP